MSTAAAPAAFVTRATATTAATLAHMRTEWKVHVDEVRRNHVRCQALLDHMRRLASTTEEVIVESRASLQLAEAWSTLRVRRRLL